MKRNKELFLKLGWRIKFRARVALSRAGERMGKVCRAAAKTLRRLGDAFCAAWRMAGYYICLALLLVVLGAAAYGYRMRNDVPEQTASAPVGDEAVWFDFAAETPLPTPEEEGFMLAQPVPGEVIRTFENASLSWSKTLEQWQTHPGVDFAAELGEVVRAAEDGEVIAAYKDVLLGNVIEIRHENGWVTRYAALNTLELVEIGQQVAQGETISSAANTALSEEDLGAHVHFELLVDGLQVEPEFGGQAQ